eukprot:scaffold36602_cov15-Tisochrysis_lutea.AAC.1
MASLPALYAPACARVCNNATAICAEVVGGLENKGEEKVQQQEGSSRRGPAERGTDVRERVPACLSELEASTAESARRSEDADYFFKL